MDSRKCQTVDASPAKPGDLHLLIREDLAALPLLHLLSVPTQVGAPRTCVIFRESGPWVS